MLEMKYARFWAYFYPEGNTGTASLKKPVKQTAYLQVKDPVRRPALEKGPARTKQQTVTIVGV
jgi:hypothetical protein